ncbi:MAG: excinuclease ABC subunit B, partial [Parcubacteria group bacterium QH_9_35_7]
FTMANVIENVQMPTLVIAHNKTLAAQLCNEFREFFPENAVQYFVSYYDYYQPEAYVPGSNTYIEKETQINEEIDRLRHASTQSILTRNDVIIVASVSAIYGLGSPDKYEKIVLKLKQDQELNRREMMEQLVKMQFDRTKDNLERGTFKMRGQVFEIMPVHRERIYRFEITDKIERIEEVDPVTRNVVEEKEEIWFFPAEHYVTSESNREQAIKQIQKELQERLEYFEKQGKMLEYERLKRRVKHDIEMIREVGYCNGIENYSRYFDNREPGEAPFTLIDYFKHNHDNFLTIIDESHVTIPQIGGMYAGDKSRKETLIEHGFRLPSAKDNRPLKFYEFEDRIDQTVFTSATPDEYELEESEQVVEQIVRPTGLVDPEVLIRPITPLSQDKSGKIHKNEDLYTQDEIASKNKSQVDDLIDRIKNRIESDERTLVTTLTKKMAEDLTDHLKKDNISVKYLHSDIDTLDRVDIIHDLRKGKIDVIVGVNLLREGLDIPEVSLVAILDADKEGFLRSETTLVQTMGRAARNVNGQVVLYADELTGSLENAIEETERRREIQLEYNREHNITPETIEKRIKNILDEFGIIRRNLGGEKVPDSEETLDLELKGDDRDLEEIIKEKEEKMEQAADDLDFETAAVLRDEIRELKLREKSQ